MKYLCISAEAVGKIERDQVEDYARGKNKAVEEMESLLSSNLNYRPGVTGRDKKAA